MSTGLGTTADNTPSRIPCASKEAHPLLSTTQCQFFLQLDHLSDELGHLCLLLGRQIREGAACLQPLSSHSNFGWLHLTS